MYSLNDDVTNPAYTASGRRLSLYAEGVKYKRMQVGEGSALRIRILPAHDPAKATMNGERIIVDPLSWVPFRSPDGNLNTWGRKIYLVQFVGHGPKGKGTRRRDFISLKSYSGDGETYCPIVALQDAIRREPIWQYLTKDTLGADGKTVTEGKCIARDLSVSLLTNIIDISNLGDGVQLAVFSKSAYDKLLSKDEGGIAWQRNLSATPDQIAANPMLAWACGDLTHPTEGPVLEVKKDTSNDNRRFAGYTIDYCVTTQGVMRYAVDDSIMASRYNLLDLHTVIPKPTEEELILGLVEQLDGFAPTGEHEYELLRHVFGSMVKIPDPPAKTYSPGMGAQPTVPAAVQSGTPVMNSSGASDFVQPKIGTGNPPPIPQPTAPVTQHGYVQQVPPPAQPAAPVQPAAPATPVVPATPVAPAQPAVPAQPAAPATPVAPAQPAAPATPVAPAPAMPTAAAPIPGDAPPAFDRENFLTQLKQGQQ